MVRLLGGTDRASSTIRLSWGSSRRRERSAERRNWRAAVSIRGFRDWAQWPANSMTRPRISGVKYWAGRYRAASSRVKAVSSSLSSGRSK